MRHRIRPKLPRPTAQQIRRWFSYEPESGSLRWRIDVRNGRGDGYVRFSAGSEVVASRSRYVAVKNQMLVVADIIYVLMMGGWPSQRIDHRDGDPSNRKWNNLRLATPQQNAMNHRRHSNNTSGYPGVKWHDKRKYGRPKWWTVIDYKGKRISLGLFDDRADAIAARQAAERNYFGEWKRDYNLKP